MSRVNAFAPDVIPFCICAVVAVLNIQPVSHVALMLGAFILAINTLRAALFVQFVFSRGNVIYIVGLLMISLLVTALLVTLAGDLYSDPELCIIGRDDTRACVLTDLAEVGTVQP